MRGNSKVGERRTTPARPQVQSSHVLSGTWTLENMLQAKPYPSLAKWGQSTVMGV